MHRENGAKCTLWKSIDACLSLLSLTTGAWFGYFRLFIVATGCPSERPPTPRRRLVVTSKSKSKSLYSPSNVKHYTWGYDRIMKSSKVW